MFGSDDSIKLGYTDSKLIGTIVGNIYKITLGIDVGTELVYLDGSFDGSNDGNIEGLLINKVLVSTGGKKLGYDEGTIL